MSDACYDRGGAFSPKGLRNDGAPYPFRVPETLPILNPSNFVPKNGFPVVKELKTPPEKTFQGLTAGPNV